MDDQNRDLLISTHTPALGSGQMLRTYGVARALAAHRGLDLLYVQFGAPEPDQAFRAIPGVELVPVEPSRGVRRALTYAWARGRRVPAGFARGISPELSAAAVRLSERRHGRVIADGPIAAAALAGLARERPVIYNAHNLESAFRPALDGRRSSKRALEERELRSFERGLLGRATEAWMVSPADMRGARELCPQARLRYVPNVVDVAAIEPVRTPAAEEPPRATFVASFSYAPNRNGLRFLLEDVFPRVWRELPQARLSLVGAGLEHAPSSDPRVETLGFVESLRDVYARSRCALVPLLQGGGTPLKLIEALAYGLPVIATARAAAGLQLRDGEHCLLADDGDSFAAALLRVRRDGAPRLAARGRALAGERYSIEALATLLAPAEYSSRLT
jgi:glycosyltransferase involved in cell wall biosynthesis